MTENEMKFLEVAKKYELVKEELSKVGEELQAALALLPIGSYLQDPATKLVYRICKPTGTFVSFKDRDYQRTAKEGERSGTVSKKDAQEAGFVL